MEYPAAVVIMTNEATAAAAILPEAEPSPSKFEAVVAVVDTHRCAERLVCCLNDVDVDLIKECEIILMITTLWLLKVNYE